MSKQEFETLLGDFRELAQKVGSVPFDLCWHHLTGHDAKVSVEGGCPDLTWPEVEEDELPFDTEHRVGFARLGRLLDTTGKVATVGFGWVTIPTGRALELTVWVSDES